MRCTAFLLLGCALLGVTGCHRKPLAPAAEKPVVAVSYPVFREDVIDFEDFIGRTDAVESVDIKARVSGYLVQIAFQSGSVVRGDERPECYVASMLGMLGSAHNGPLFAAACNFPRRGSGDLLFVVDPRPYQADYDRAAGQVLLAEAKLTLAIADFARALEIAKTPGAISKQDIDKYAAARDEARAEVIAAKANLESYRLNLEFCRITSPINGMTSRNFLTLGNLVTKDETLLTTVVSEDPMYTYFDVDENTMLRLQAAVRAGKVRSPREGDMEVLMALANEKGYPHRGIVDFINNKLDPLTGTRTLRGVFANAKPKVGPRYLTPGLFVRVRVPIGDPRPALLVSDKVIGADQGQRFVYVVDEKNTVQYRRVTPGALQEDGLRVVQGLEKTDRVVISGLQTIRPNEEVRVSEEKMPMNRVSEPIAAPKEPAKKGQP
jgi:multidrug efflux system membrane fusion protein